MKLLNVAVGVIASLLLASSASAEVQLSIQNGRVSLKAKDATLRQIMQEWARVGQTKIVNVERIPGGPMTLELTNVTEAEALEILLRSVSGYIAAPRAVAAANTNSISRFDRIVVMATTVAPRQAVSAAPPSPVFQPPQMPQPVVDDDPDDAPAGARPPIFGAFPQPQVVNPAQQQGGQQPLPPGFNPPPGYVPPPGFGQVPNGGGQQPAQPNAPTNTFGAPTFGAPTGVAVPGMMVPVPQQPGQPGVVQPGQQQPQGRGRGGLQQ
jgi:hypothetical protein